MKLILKVKSYKDGEMWFETEDGQRITNLMVLQTREDVSSVGRQEGRVWVDLTMLETDVQPVPEPRKIKKGDRIAISGVRSAPWLTIEGTVTSAINYANSKGDDWYIEFKQDNGTPGYWKQQYDGGQVKLLKEVPDAR